MRTRSADAPKTASPAKKTPPAKRSAAKNQNTPGAAELATGSASGKRTPAPRAKKAKIAETNSTPNSAPSKLQLAAEEDGAVQSTPEAKPASSSKTTRRVVRKVVKKTPASTKAASDKTPKAVESGKTKIEEPANEKSKEDPLKEKYAEDAKEDPVNEKHAEESKDDPGKQKEAEDSKEDPVNEKGAEASKEDPVNEKDAEDFLEDPIEEEDTEYSKEDPVNEKQAEDSKEDLIKQKEAEDSKEAPVNENYAEDLLEDPVEEEDTDDSKEDPAKEKDAEDLKEDPVKQKEAEASKGDPVNDKYAEDFMEDPVEEEDAGDSKEDPVDEKYAEDFMEDPVEEEDAENSKEDTVNQKDTDHCKEGPVMEKDAVDAKEDPVKEKDTDNSKEGPVKEKDTDNSKEGPVKEKDTDNSMEGPVKEKDAEDSEEGSAKATNDDDSKEDLTNEKDAVGLRGAELAPQCETDPMDIEELSETTANTAQDVGVSAMEDQNGIDEKAGEAQESLSESILRSPKEVNVVNDARSSEHLGNEVQSSENQGPIVTDGCINADIKSADNQELAHTTLKSEEGVGCSKAQEEVEFKEEKDNHPTSIVDNLDIKIGAHTLEEDIKKKMKGKDTSVGEDGEDKIEAFTDQEDGVEFGEDDVTEHFEEDETLEDECAQLNALAKEQKKRKELEVFVGGLDRDAVEEDVKRVFQHVGEVVHVRMHKELSTNKNKGYAFVKFATKEQASRALAEMKNPVIRGKRCGTAPSEGNDTLFLGNICNTWTKESIRQKLKDYGIEGVENVTLVADSKQEGLSRGFAFLEFPCHTDAMTAYQRLQKPDVVFGHSERTAKVAFAEPLREPDPDVMAQVKSVFIDGIPPYWDEDRLREKFRGFGEIARIILARNMSTAKRKDFGFVDFNTHEAAVACIEGINNTELGDGNLKARVRARLSNPLPKTQAVKGGMCGGFRIGRGPTGRGFPRGGHTFGRASFPRGRGFYPRGRGRGGRLGFNEPEFDRPYPPFQGRPNFGRGGRWDFRGGHPPPVEDPISLDRMRPIDRSRAPNHPIDRAHAPNHPIDRTHAPNHPIDRAHALNHPIDRAHANDALFRRHPFPVEGGFHRPFMGRHFEEHYSYDNAAHGVKRPFFMTDPEPHYVETSRRPRLDYTSSAVPLRETQYRDNFPPGGDRYARGYHGSDYAGGPYPSFRGGHRPYGRGYY